MDYRQNPLLHPLLLHTDQASCFDEFGEEIPCPGSGQDAERRRVPEAAGTGFETAGGIVKDRQTGLYWTRSASPHFPDAME